MSADPDIEDFEQVTSVEPPAKVTPTAKKATPPSRQAKSRDEIKAELAADFEQERKIRDEIRAELEAEYRAKLAALPVPEADASFEGLTETPYIHVEPQPGEIVIHMVDDGLTFGQKVWLRGEELAINPDENPWVNYSRKEQIARYGKQLYERGPWPYGGFDLTDPALTPEDKKRLIQATSSESFG